MSVCKRTKKITFWVAILVLILQILGSYGEDFGDLTEEEQQEIINEQLKEENRERVKEENKIPHDLGTGVHEAKDLMDECKFAAGPRPINEVFSPGRTFYATVDDVNGGYCGVSIDSPGIWWWVEGTGDPVTVSTCHNQTDIKVKFSVFTGSCDDLQCVTGGAEPDFECPLLRRKNDLGEWDTMASAITFESKIDQNYYILVQQQEMYGRGTVWLNFRHPNVPQNNNCVDAIGPVPRDMTRIENSNIDATVSKVHDYCGGEEVPSLYPGTWFQIMGTGEPVTVMACSEFNFDGFAFSVYNGAYCNGMECVKGDYEINVDDPEKCTFGPYRVERKLTKYTFDTNDRDRYWIYVHFARTSAETPTADFRFYVDDGREGDASSSGAHMIEIESIRAVSRQEEESDDNKNEDGESSGTSLGFHRGGLSLFVFLISLMIQDYGII
jgi:hypothetical protein